MQPGTLDPLPAVSLWRVNLLRVCFLVLAVVMGGTVWSQLLFESADWPVIRGIAKSMLAALALLSLLGVRHPLPLLPLMLYEIAWKTIWLVFIALRAWLSGKWTAEIEALFTQTVGIVIVYFVVPWRYVWARYVAQPMEPLRPMAWRDPH
jgi:hypothetical protein